MLYLIEDSVSQDFGYRNISGDTIIPLGKYITCWPDTFDKMAIVTIPYKGSFGIDRKENILFKVYPFDNGPDYPSEGLFRIVKEGKIGFADLDGNIVIEPKYDGAFPFEKGIAKVCIGCILVPVGEYHQWQGGRWFYINRKGKIVKK